VKILRQRLHSLEEMAKAQIELSGRDRRKSATTSARDNRTDRVSSTKCLVMPARISGTILHFSNRDPRGGAPSAKATIEKFAGRPPLCGGKGRCIRSSEPTCAEQKSIDSSRKAPEQEKTRTETRDMVTRRDSRSFYAWPS